MSKRIFCALVFIVWAIGNICSNTGSFSRDIKLKTAKWLQDYACKNYGTAVLVNYTEEQGKHQATLEDVTLEFRYTVVAEVVKTGNPMPYKEQISSDFMAAYQQAILTRLDTTHYQTSKFAGLSEMSIYAESSDLAECYLQELLNIDKHNHLSKIYLYDMTGQTLGYYDVAHATRISGEEFSRQYFTYEFQEIIDYPYSFSYLGCQECKVSEIPGVELFEVYEYYESVSKPVPTLAHLYWFEFGSGEQYFVADVLGMNGQRKYYTNFRRDL